MCLLHYRRLPDDVYRLRYGDPRGQILPLFWLGGCVLCLWVSLFAAVTVALLARDLLAGLAVGAGGAILGLLTSTSLAVGFPEIDARWLRLGPLAVLVELSTIFAGAAVVVLLGAAVLVGAPPAAADTAAALIATAPDQIPFDLRDAVRRVFALLFVASLLVSAARHFLRRS